MGLRSPQQMNQVAPEAMPTARVRTVAAEKLNLDHLNKLSNAVDLVESANKESERRMAMIVKARFREEADKRRLERENKVSSTEGWNVLNVSREESQGLDKDLQELKSRFDEKYGYELDTTALDVKNRFTRATQPYTISEVKKTTKKTYDAVLANEINDTVMDSFNVEEFGGNLDRISELVKERAAVQYGEDPNTEIMPGVKLSELVDNEVKAAESTATVNSIVQMARVNELGRARDLLNKYGDRMTADDRLKAIQAIEQRVNSDESKAASALAELAFRTADSLEGAEQYISDNALSDKMQRSAMAFFKNKVAMREQQKKANIANTEASIMDQLAQGKTLDQVNDLMSRLPVENQASLIEHINKNNGKVIPSVTDEVAFNKALDDLYNNRSEALSNPNFVRSLRNKLAPDDYNFLERQYNSMKKASADSQEYLRINTDKAIMGVANRFNAERNYFDPAEQAKNKRLAIQYADAEIAKNPKIDQKELERKVTARLYAESVSIKQVPRGAFSKAWNTIFGGFFGDGRDYSVERVEGTPDAVSPTGESIRYDEDTQEAFREKARERYRQRGIQPDEAKIEQILRTRIINGQPL